MRCEGEADAGEEVDEASEVLFWKRLFTSNFAVFGVDEEPDVDGAVDEEDVDGAVEDDEDDDAAAVAPDGGVPVENEMVRVWIFPFVFAGTDPKDLIPSDFIVGAAAGEDEIGALASSMDPKVTDEPGNR